MATVVAVGAEMVAAIEIAIIPRDVAIATKLFFGPPAVRPGKARRETGFSNKEAI